MLVAVVVPLALCALVLTGPRLLRLGRRSRSPFLARAANTIGRLLAQRLAQRAVVASTAVGS
jgi:hypothetical protein